MSDTAGPVVTLQRARDNWRSRIASHADVPPSDLLPSPLNARRHPANQAAALDGVLDELGWIQSVVVSQATGRILDGHLRVERALAHGEPTVPVVYVEVTEQEEAYALATLDPISAMASTDATALTALLERVGTDDDAVRAMLDGLAADAGILAAPSVAEDPGAQIDRAEELRAKWGTERGQLWTVGRHRLLCGDSTSAEDVARLMGGDRADCVFTSPPYGVGIDYGTYQDTIDNLRAMLPLLAARWLSVVMAGGFAVVNFGDIAPASDVAKVDGPCEYPMALEYWPVFMGAGWVLWSRRVWCKPNARVNSMWCIQCNRAATDWEHVWTWKAPGEAIVKRVDGPHGSPKGWFGTSSDVGVDVGKETHGAGMATSAATRMIVVHSRENGIVHEPFTGTGTTLVAAEQTGRICYGMELEPKYIAVALERLSGMGLTPRLT